MRVRFVRLISYLAVAMIAGTCLGFGSWFHDSSMRQTTVILGQTCQLKNGDVLPAGRYEMEFPKNAKNPSVEFFKVYTTSDGAVSNVASNAAASSPAKLVMTNNKNAHTEVISAARGNSQMIQAILPAGTHDRLVFVANR